MAGIELAQAWVTISPRTKGMQKEIDKQLKGIESKGEKTGSKLGARITDGVKKSLKVGLVAAGAAGAAAFGAALKKGFDRLDAIEQAKVKFEALGHSAKQQAALMDDVTAAVKGTAFSTSEAANAAAMAIAGGIKPGKELTGVLKTIGDSASFANRSFAEVAPIYTRAINTGKVMGDTLAQLEDNAIPATQALSKSMGKSAQDIRDMASDGQISFRDLQKAMDATIGGQALKAGDTFSGSLDNIGAAWARVGETILKTPFSVAPKVFGRIAKEIDVANDRLKGFMELFQTGDFTREIGVKLAGGDEKNPVLEDSAIVDRILDLREKSIEAIDTIKRKWGEFQAGFQGRETEGLFNRLGKHMGVLAGAATRLIDPLARIAASLGEAGMTASMVSLISVLEALTPIIVNVLVPMLDKLSVLMVENQGAVTALVMAFMGFRTAKAAAGGLSLFAGKATEAMSAAKTGVGFVRDLGGAMQTSWKYASQAAPGMGAFGKASMIMGANVKAAGLALTNMSGPIGMAARGIRLLGLVIAANPIGAIVTAVVAAGAALTWFFMKTETGKRMWASFMDFLLPIIGSVADAFRSLSETVSSTWESKIKPVLSAFVNVLRWVAAISLTVVLTPMILAWKLLSTIIKWSWENIIRPTWDGIVWGARFMWNSVLKPIFSWIKIGWQLVAMGIRTWWITQIMPTWNALNVAARFMWNSVLSPIFNAIKATWQAMASGIKWVWETIILTSWNALKAALSDLYSNIIRPIFQWIGDRWRDMSRVLGDVTSWIVRNVFGSIGAALETVRGWFSSAVNAIRIAWDQVANVARKPIAFVVTTVFNEGILKAWNAVSDFVGLKDKKLTPLPPVPAYARGGVLPGYTPGRDVHDFYSPTGGMLRLSGGEAVMRPEWTRAVGGPAAVDRMNREAVRGSYKRPSKAQLRDNRRIAKAHAHADGGVIQAFSNGGVVRAMENIIGRKYPMLVPVFSGYRPGSDYHGAGLAGDFSNGMANTPEMTSLANDIADTYPGSLELIYEAPGFERQIKHGKFVGGGGGSWGFYAGAGNHANHVHWAMDTPPTMPFGGGVFKGGSSSRGGGNGFGAGLRAAAKAAWDAAIGKIAKFKGDAGPWTEVPGAFLKKAASTMWDWIASKLPLGGGGGGSASWDPGAGAEQWRGMLIKAFKFQGEEPTKERVDALIRQIWTESKGDPNIAQQIVDVNGTGEAAGVGLYQVIPSTWEGYRDPTLSPNRRDPWAQHNFAVRYFRDRHGWNTGPGGVGRGHGWKAGGVLPFDLPAALFDQGGYLKHNTVAVNKSGSPEPVFTAAQWATLKRAVLSNEQWARVARPMVDRLEKLANDGREKRKAQKVEVDGEVSTVDAEPVDPRVVGAEIAAGLVEGQLDDALGVFGLPSLGDVPAVKAAIEANKAVVDAGGDSDPRVEALEGGVKGAFVDMATRPASLGHLARVAPALAGASASVVGAAASGNPVAVARAAGDAAGAVNITVASTQRAFSEYRKLQAKRSAGSRGVR